MENLSAMPGVRADIARARTADLLAGTRGSPTAQNLSTQAIMERITGDSRIGANTGAVDSLGNSILSALVSGPSRVAGDFLFGAPNEAIRELLTNAMLDPRLAARLLQSARKLPEQRIADMLRGYGRAGGAIGVRQGLLEMFGK